MHDTGGMTRLRNVDGSPLPSSDVRVAVTQPKTPAIFDRLLEQPLLVHEFVRRESEALDKEMERAETDETLSVEQQDACIKHVLLHQVLLLGLAVFVSAPSTGLLELLDDLSTTLDRLSPRGAGMDQVLAPIKRSYGMQELEPVPLLPDEYVHAVASVMEQAAQAAVAVDPAAAERLRWAGYQAPTLLKSPLTPLRAALLPPATRAVERMPAEQELRHLAQSTLGAERNTALLLLYVNARDRLEDAPLVGVMDLAHVLLLTLRRHHQEQGTPSGVTDRLLYWHEQLHQQLGRPHLRETQLFKRYPSSGLERETHRARRRLRALRAQRQGPVGRIDQLQLKLLWASLDALDLRLSRGEDPEADQDLKASLLLSTLLALTSVARVPGMSLPPFIEMAVRISDVDPLWAWERTQPQDSGDPLLKNELIAVIEGVLLKASLEKAPHLEVRVWKALRLAAGHLFATTRRAGLRLPGQSFLEDYCQQFGTLQALPLHTDQLRTLRRELGSLLSSFGNTIAQEATGNDFIPEEGPTEYGDVATHLQGPPTPPEIVIPADPGNSSGATLPEHVVAARGHLQGRRIVLLGGTPRPDHHEALVRTLDLRELDWIASDEYAHGTHAHSRVTHDTALVILAVRWMGHAHNTLREVARDMDVPYVMHPGGLSPNSVAWQIMHQVSRQLEARDGSLVG